MKLVRLRVRQGFVVHHRDPRSAGSRFADWRELQPGERFRARPRDAEQLIEQGAAAPIRRWRR